MNMKWLIMTALLAVATSGGATFVKAQQQLDSLKIYFSLFSEDHKNDLYEDALKTGWKVMRMDTANEFTKWVVNKMDDILWYHLNDNEDIDEATALALADSAVMIYDLGIEYDAVNKGYYQIRKARVIDYNLNADDERKIAEYETAIEYDPEVGSFWYKRLGDLYMAHMEEKPDYKTKAIDLYTFLSEKYPDDAEPIDKLNELIEDEAELVAIREKAWNLDKENLAKAWNYAAAAMRADMYQEALAPLEFLVAQSPETVNYWDKLATAYHKTENLSKATDAYSMLVELEPQEKRHYLNLGIVYMERGQFSSARSQFRKASSVGDGWALPVFYEGMLYENAARGCGSFDFMDKCVFRLAQLTYLRAASMDPSLSQAQSRANALSASVPTQEDYFFKQYNSGQSIAIQGGCYGWIGKSITVP